MINRFAYERPMIASGSRHLSRPQLSNDPLISKVGGVTPPAHRSRAAG